MKLKDSLDLEVEIYKVFLNYKVDYDTRERNGTETKTEFIGYAVGHPKDIRAYFNIKAESININGYAKKIEISKLELPEDITQVTPESGKKAREFIKKRSDLEKEVDSMRKEIK